MAREEREHSFFIEARKREFLIQASLLRHNVKSLVSQASLLRFGVKSLGNHFLRIYFVKWLVLYFRSCKHKKCNILVRCLIIVLVHTTFARSLVGMYRSSSKTKIPFGEPAVLMANGETILESFFNNRILIFPSNRVVMKVPIEQIILSELFGSG